MDYYRLGCLNLFISKMATVIVIQVLFAGLGYLAGKMSGKDWHMYLY